MTSAVTEGHGDRDLEVLFNPRSIAIVGASNDPGKWGYWLARGAVKGEGRRKVFFVNPAGREVLGRPAFGTVEELPDAPELVVVAVPLQAFEATIDAALARGARAIIAINAGFGELGSDGQSRQATLVRKVRDAGALLVGPNCLGVVDTSVDLEAAWIQVGDEGLPPGEIAFFSQSGNLGHDVGLMAREASIGFSRFASLGNQADVTAADLVAAAATHDETRLIAVYCEDFKDGRAFMRAAHKAVTAGKPVVVLAPGASEAASRAARSHTGALATDAATIDAAFRAVGIVRVSTPRELIQAAEVLLRSGPAPGRRVGIIGDGGGHSVIASDIVAESGLTVPSLSEPLRSRLIDVLSPSSGVGNPVDLAAANTDPVAFERAARLLMSSGEVDAILLTGYFGNWSVYDEQLGSKEVESGRAMGRAAAEAGIPLVAQTMVPSSPAALALRDAGASVFRAVDDAARALGRAADAGTTVTEGVPELPERSWEPVPREGYFGAREVLISAGITFPRAREVATEDEAIAAAEEFGYPVVLKAVHLLHKSDRGGVFLNLGDAQALRTAFRDLSGHVPAQTYCVEQMIDTARGVELVIGTRRDPRFGPMLLVGFGGIYTEILKDSALALAPVTVDDAVRLLDRLRMAPLLHGVRGQSGLDVQGAARAAAAISELSAARPDITEIEINPLLVAPDRVIGLDAMVLWEPSDTSRKSDRAGRAE